MTDIWSVSQGCILINKFFISQKSVDKGSPKRLRNVKKIDMQRLKKEQCSLFKVITRFA